MNSINQQKASRVSFSSILIFCLTQLLSSNGASLAQTAPIRSTTTTTVTTKGAPLTKPTVTTTTTTVIKKRPTHLKKRRGKVARRTTHKSTTVVRTNSALSGGVAKTHKHRVVHGDAMEATGSAQQRRSNKLNAFLKTNPTMKKAPYTNPPGLDVPSSPAL